MTRNIISLIFSRNMFTQDPMRVVRLAIVAGISLASAFLAFFITSDQLIMILVFLALCAGILLLLRWPGLGYIFAIVGGVTLPDVGPKNINIPMVMIASLFLLWLVDMVVRQRKVRVVPSRTMLPLFVFILASIFAFGLGQFSWYSFAVNAPMDAQLGGLGIFVLSSLAFILVANQITTLKWLKAITWSFIAIGSIYLILRVVPGLSVIREFIFRANSFGGIFWAWFPTLAFSQMLINRDLHPFWRVFLGVMVLVALYAGLGQAFDWKSGWMPQLIGIVTVAAIYSWRWSLAFTVIGIVPAVKLISNTLISDEYSLSTRLDAWIIMKEIIKVNPILGLGFANYYWYTPLFRIRGFSVRFNSHNNFVDIIAQIGLAGLAIFLWFLIEIGLLGIGLLKRVPAGFPQAYVYGAIGGLVATIAVGMLGDWFLPFVYNIGFTGVRTGILAWIFLGGLVSLEYLYRQSMTPSEQAL